VFRSYGFVRRPIPIDSVMFLPARRYASAGNSDRNVSVRPSVRHALVLCQNDISWRSAASGRQTRQGWVK